MDPEAMRRARVAFRVKLSRDTGTNLDATEVAQFLDRTFTLKARLAASSFRVLVVNDPSSPPPRVCTRMSIHPEG